MIGVLVIVAVLLVIPVAFLMSTTVAAGVIGWVLKSNAESEHAGSELVDCNY